MFKKNYIYMHINMNHIEYLCQYFIVAILVNRVTWYSYR